MLGSDDEAYAVLPNYVEAWPRLNVQHVSRAAWEGRTLSVYTYASKLRIGYALAVDEGGDSFSFDYRLEQFRYLPRGRGRQVFALHETPALKGKILTTDCPVCNRRIRICVFVGKWGCSSCHKLINRSKATDHIALKQIERDQLRASLKHGRARYERQAAFDAKKARLRELDQLLADRPRREAAGALSHQVDVTYVDPATDDFYRQDNWQPG